MAWTYQDPSIPRDAVRLEIGDTDSTDPQLSDEEITWLLSQNASNIYQAAMEACTILAARYARRANKTVGDLSIQAASISKQYTELRATIRESALRHSVPVPYAAGIRQSDADEDRDDDDMVRPQFGVGMMDDIDTSIPDVLRSIPNTP